MTSVLASGENPFWDFSLHLYRNDDVAAACLRLQDRDGLDVNLVLYCCWAGTLGIHLDSQAITKLETLGMDWRQQVIGPLRAVRRALKSGIAPVGTGDSELLRDEVKRLELESERLLQGALWQSAPLQKTAQVKDCGGVSFGNLERYALVTGARPSDGLRADLQLIANAVSAVSRV